MLVVVAAVLGALLYGVLSCLLSAVFSPHYFLVSSPGLAESSVVYHSVQRGILCSWWVGVVCGLSLLLASGYNPKKRMPARYVLFCMALAFVVIFFLSNVVRVAGLISAEIGLVRLGEPFGEIVPWVVQSRYISSMWADISSYVLVLLVTISLCCFFVYKRNYMEVR